MYARPRLDDGTVPTFGVSGKLWRDSLIFYDRATRSLWSQVQGLAIAGPLAGRRLEEIPSQVTTWAEWRARHPETLVLVKPPLEDSVYAGYAANERRVGIFYSSPTDERLAPKTLVFGLTTKDADGRRVAAAVPLDRLAEARAVSFELADVSLVVVSPGGTAVQAYRRPPSSSELRAVTSDGRLVIRDDAGSAWSWDSGRCVAGPCLAPRRDLEPAPGTTAYWDIWARHHPETEIVGG